MGNPEEETNKILEEENLGSEYDPPMAVFEKAIAEYRGDMAFKARIGMIEQGYGKSKLIVMLVLAKYGMKMQNRSITETELQDMED